jgi:hypothetical protein
VRIGIVPVLDRSWGGMYQYSISFLHAVRELDLADDITVFAPSDGEMPDDCRMGRSRW